jgi:hypothetical protein
VSEPHAEISSLLGRYCWLVDHGEWERWSRCFAADGAFVTRGRRLEGREEIVAYVKEELAAFEMIRHLTHTPSLELDSGERSARCRSYFELRAVTVRGADTVALGSYSDRVTLGDEGWQFAEREADFDYWVKRGEPWYPEGAADSS